MPVRIGELLLKEKRITPDQLQQALNHQKANGGKLGYNLVKMGFVKDEEITALLSKQYGVPSINLAQFEIDVVLRTLLRNFELATTSEPGERESFRGVAFAPSKGGVAVVRRRALPQAEPESAALMTALNS